MIALAILGASGKMGGKVKQLAEKDPDFQLVDFDRCDVAIDFTAPEATVKHLDAAVAARKPLVIGTTGLSPETKQAIAEAAKKIPILFSPNFSFGVALCLDAAARLSRALPSSIIEIHETHHVHKKDSPSGTALAFAQAVKGEPKIHSTRTGEVIGEHTVIFECGHERIEIKHAAHSRDTFAQGALLGAKFLVKQPPGFYSLYDLFKKNN